jgi:transposase-like protein
MSQTTYDESFKRNAVSLVESGSPAAQVARDLNIPLHRIYAWCKEYRTTPSGHGNATVNQDEVTQLRKQVERYRAELDILKKAVGIFSQPIR